MEKLKIEYVNIDKIKPYENNPRDNTKAIEKVANSIKQFGFKVPMVIDKDNIIIAGHTRYEACKKLGIKQVPCIIATDLTDKEIKAFRIADNKTNDTAEWNDDLLSIELKDIMGDFDMTDFGFGEFELSILTEDMEPEGYDEDLIKEYSSNADEFLKAKRLIITYVGEEQENYLKKLFNTEELKVSYTTEELMGNE